MQPLYICLFKSKFGDRGTNMAMKADPTAYIDCAADDLAECQREGDEARVYRMGFHAGTLIDVTAQCEAIIAARCRERGIAAE
jgi:hypothetical protein